MPRHFLYVMDPSAKAPAGTGDTQSWFHFYKWKVEGEVFVPRARPYYPAQIGDFLWFAFLTPRLTSSTGRLESPPIVFGGAAITRVEEESHQQEVWYRGDAVFHFAEPIEFKGTDLEVDAALGEEWMLRRPLKS